MNLDFFKACRRFGFKQNFGQCQKCKSPVNHVFSTTSRFSIFMSKNKIYDDTRRSCKNYYVLQGTQSTYKSISKNF